MNLTRLHLDILHCVARQKTVERPRVTTHPNTAVDRAVLELVEWGLIEGVEVPRIGDDPPHWEPLGLTSEGWKKVRPGSAT